MAGASLGGWLAMEIATRDALRIRAMTLHAFAHRHGRGAKTVRETLIGYVKEAGLGKLLALLQFGTLPADLTRRNMERFTESVMPDLRKAAKEFHGETVL